MYYHGMTKKYGFEFVLDLEKIDHRHLPTIFDCNIATDPKQDHTPEFNICWWQNFPLINRRFRFEIGIHGLYHSDDPENHWNRSKNVEHKKT